MRTRQLVERLRRNLASVDVELAVVLDVEASSGGCRLLLSDRYGVTKLARQREGLQLAEVAGTFALAKAWPE